MEEKSLKVLGDNIVYCIDYITGIKIWIKMNRLLAKFIEANSKSIIIIIIITDIEKNLFV